MSEIQPNGIPSTIFKKTFLTPQASTSSQRPWISSSRSTNGQRNVPYSAKKLYYIAGIIAVIVLITISAVIIGTWNSSGDDGHPSSGEGIKALFHFPTIPKSQQQHKKVQIAIYYSAQDSVSTRFITNQLIPTYFKLKEFIGKVEFIPFGHTSTSISSNGSLSFTCPNGPLECDWNIIDSCASDLIDNQDDVLRYIGCIMRRDLKDPEWIGSKCANELFLPIWNDIKNCWKGPKGPKLLQENGERTREIEPGLKILPTVLINGSQTNQSQILNDFEGYLSKFV